MAGKLEGRGEHPDEGSFQAKGMENPRPAIIPAAWQVLSVNQI